MEAEKNQRARTALLISIGISGLLLFLPNEYYRWVAWPLMLFSTFTHEMGHGIAALLIGGNFHSFEMFANGSGVAHISYAPSSLKSAFTSAGGLLGPAVMAALLFFLGRRERRAQIGLLVLGAAFLLADLLVVRTTLGLVYVGILGALCLFFALKTSPEAARIFVLFLGVQLAFSVYTRGDYLFTDTANTSAGVLPSDVAQIANALFPPYWFWGIVCAAFSVVVLLVGVLPFLRQGSQKS